MEKGQLRILYSWFLAHNMTLKMTDDMLTFCGKWNEREYIDGHFKYWPSHTSFLTKYMVDK